MITFKSTMTVAVGEAMIERFCRKLRFLTDLC